MAIRRGLSSASREQSSRSRDGFSCRACTTMLKRISSSCWPHCGNASRRKLKMDYNASSCLQKFLRRLDNAERLLLPARKQRELEEMDYTLEHMIEVAKARRDRLTLDLLIEIQN